ncbi:hypothetical protein G6M19_13695 [Agrobacterium tumefaciens]|nr:hypothetical protein [Agrobacterium tumefaciens]
MDIAIDDWHFFGIVFVSVAIGALLGIRVAGKIGFRFSVGRMKSNLA